MFEISAALTNTKPTLEGLLKLNMDLGMLNFKVMGMLSKAHRDVFGVPRPTGTHFAAIHTYITYFHYAFYPFRYYTTKSYFRNYLFLPSVHNYYYYFFFFRVKKILYKLMKILLLLFKNYTHICFFKPFQHFLFFYIFKNNYHRSPKNS